MLNAFSTPVKFNAKSIRTNSHIYFSLQFAKMLKMHLPEGAVRQKMMAEGLSAADIALFFGEAPPGGAKIGIADIALLKARGAGVAPHKKMKPLYWDSLKMKVCKGSWWERLANAECAEEIGVELETVVIAAAPRKSKRRSSFSKLSTMLGGAKGDEKEAGDSTDGVHKYGGEVLLGEHRLLLESLFAKPQGSGKKAKKPDDSAAKAAAAAGEVKLISGRRAQNVTIAVMKLNLTDAALEDALLSYNEQVVTEGVLELLEIVFPFEDEVSTLQAHMGSPAFDFSKLRLCERYQCRLMSVPRYAPSSIHQLVAYTSLVPLPHPHTFSLACSLTHTVSLPPSHMRLFLLSNIRYHERVTVLQLKAHARTRMKEVTTDFDHVYGACDQLHGRHFHQLLATLLEIGNFCNSGTVSTGLVGGSYFN
jgi:hypothetical protein